MTHTLRHYHRKIGSLFTADRLPHQVYTPQAMRRNLVRGAISDYTITEYTTIIKLTVLCTQRDKCIVIFGISIQLRRF